MIQSTFQQYDSLTSDGCIFQFFAILGRFNPLDVDKFVNCAIGVSYSLSLFAIIVLLIGGIEYSSDYYSICRA